MLSYVKIVVCNTRNNIPNIFPHTIFPFPHIFLQNCNTNKKLWRASMKITDKKKPVDTIPQGVWESSRPEPNKTKNDTLTASTDLQGNGYPVDKHNK